MARRTNPNAHPMQPGPDLTEPDAGGGRWPACVVCGKSVRAHPRRSHDQVIAAKAKEARAMRAAYKASLAAPQTPEAPTAPGLSVVPVATVLPAPEPSPAREKESWQAALLLIAVDRFLVYPEDRPDHPGWRVTARLREVKAILEDKPIPHSDLTPVVPHRERRQPDAPVTFPSRTHSARRVLRGFRSPELRDIVKTAMDQGFTCDLMGNGHLRCRSLTGEFHASLTSDGGGRAVENTRADARRAGVAI